MRKFCSFCGNVLKTREITDSYDPYDGTRITVVIGQCIMPRYGLVDRHDRRIVVRPPERSKDAERP